MDIELPLSKEIIEDIGELNKEGWFEEQGNEFVSIVKDAATSKDGVSLLYGFNDTVTVSVEQQKVIEFVKRLKELSEEHNRTEWHVRKKLLVLTAMFFMDEHKEEIVYSVRKSDEYDFEKETERDIKKAYEVLLNKLLEYKELSVQIARNSILSETDFDRQTTDAFIKQTTSTYRPKWNSQIIKWVNMPAPIDKVNHNNEI